MNLPLLFHIHIPKSAGSTFGTILSKSFGPAFLHENPYLSTLKYKKNDIIEMIEFYSFKCYSGHVFALPNLPFDNYPDLKAISFSRDPIDKYISYYFFQRSRRESSERFAAKRLVISEYIEWHKSLDFPNQLYTDGSQVDWVLGRPGGSLNEIEKYVGQGRYHILPTERFDEACVVLERLFPDIFRDCSYSRAFNASVKDQFIDPEVIDRIRGFDWIKRDEELHSFSNRHLDHLIDKVFNNRQHFENALQDFICRNNRKSRVEAVIEMKKKMVFRGKNFLKKCFK